MEIRTQMAMVLVSMGKKYSKWDKLKMYFLKVKVRAIQHDF